MTNETDVWKELLAQKAVVLLGIADSGHDNAKLRQLTEWLRRELDLESKYKGILSEAERLIAERQRGVVQSSAEKSITKHHLEADAKWTFADLTKQERGQVARRAFFKRQDELGNTFKTVGKLYHRRIGDGVVLGVTYSSEDDGKWFFNLRENFFQEAVLLCQCGPRSVKAIHLPKEFLERYQRHLSRRRSKGTNEDFNEVLFNILRDEGKWLLQVPQPTGVLDVTNFAEPDELLCSRYDNEFV